MIADEHLPEHDLELLRTAYTEVSLQSHPLVFALRRLTEIERELQGRIAARSERFATEGAGRDGA